MADGTDVDDILRGYVAPDEADVAQWWQQADIAIDTNVLLHLYRYSAAARGQLLAVLNGLGGRLWVPRRVAEEFARSRVKVLHEQLGAHSQFEQAFDDWRQALPRRLQQIESALGRPHREHALSEAVTTALDAERRRLLDQEQARFSDSADVRNDPLVGEIRALLSGRIGLGLSAERISELTEEIGPDRYENSIPPGFLDGKKDDDQRFGDLIIWFELIERARRTGRPVVFVTDDVKDDWRARVGGALLGPRPELVQELWDEAGVPLLLYTTVRFVERTRTELELREAVSAESLEEISEVTTRPFLDFTGIGSVAEKDPFPLASVQGDRVQLALLYPPSPQAVYCMVRLPDERSVGRDVEVGLTQLAAGPVTFPHQFLGAGQRLSGTHTVVWWDVPLTRILAETTFEL